MSDLTSLKVPFAVRDRFAAAAKARGITVRALLDQLSREVADAARRGPGAWDDYLAEGRHWEEGTTEPVDA